MKFDTIKAQSSQSKITKIEREGYIPIGIAGWANQGSTLLYIYQCNVVSGELIVSVKNTSSGDVSDFSVQVMVLYNSN